MGTLSPPRACAEDFIRAKNVVLTIDYRIIDGSDRIDTIAYIPNKTLQDAYVIIKPAFDSGDYEAVYQECSITRIVLSR